MKLYYNINKMGRLKQNQDGIASLIVTILLILIIALIVISFAQVSRTNQQEALTDQLGQQAYDAAETGLDLAYKQVSADGGVVPAETKSCNSLDAGGTPYKDIVGTAANQGNLSADGSVQVTCLLVNPDPVNLEDNSILANSSVVWEVDPATGQNPIYKLNFTWTGAPSISGTCPLPLSYDVFPNMSSYQCPMPILEVDLFQDNIGNGTATATSLNSNTINMLFEPINSSQYSALTSAELAQSVLPLNFTSDTYNGPGTGGNNPRIVACDAQTTVSKNCSINITIGPGGSTTPPLVPYFVRITPLYENASITVTPTDLNNNPISLGNSQIIIDVTARDQNVLKRIQARIPINNKSSALVLPNNALETTNPICKQLTINSTSGYYQDGCTDP